MATDPDAWGPHTWRAIHHIALGYPERPGAVEAAAYRAFFRALGPVLPCGTCAENFQRHLAREVPLTDAALAGRDALFAWTVALHNVVNRETGKRELPLAEARRLYDGAPARAGEAARAQTAERTGAVLGGLAAGLSLTGLAALAWYLYMSRRSGRAPHVR